MSPFFRGGNRGTCPGSYRRSSYRRGELDPDILNQVSAPELEQKKAQGWGDSARRRGGSYGWVVTLASAGQMLARKSQTVSGAMQLAERITWGRACRQVGQPVSLPASHPFRADSGPATWKSQPVAKRTGRQLIRVRASAVTAHGLSSCGSRAYLPCGVWDLLRSGIKLVSPALQGGFLTTGPPGKPSHRLLRKDTKVDSSWFVSCLLVCLLRKQ